MGDGGLDLFIGATTQCDQLGGQFDGTFDVCIGKLFGGRDGLFPGSSS
ncbi:hypothetical protein NKI19_13000 [Mesorhizobium sp. M0751]